MARRAKPENVYNVTILDEKGKRQVKKVKATNYAVTDTPDSVIIAFENRGVLTFAIPFHYFIQVELADETGIAVRIAQ